MFATNDVNHTHNTRNKHHLHLPKRKHEFIYTTFQYQGAHIINLLLNKVNTHVSLIKFKIFLL